MEPRDYRGVVVWNTFQDELMPTFKVKDDDVWVCSFPRSGTTLTQQIVYLVMTLDFEKAKTVPLDVRFPIADVNDSRFPYCKGLEFLDQMASPRLIKSHLHHFLLPNELQKGKAKIIYIYRNPKASIPSLFRVLKYLGRAPSPSLQEYFEWFLQGKKVYSGPWWSHVLGFWEHRHEDNLLFLQFEHLVADRKTAIRKIANFLGKNLSEEDVQRIFDYTTLESMKNNPTVNLNYMEDVLKNEIDKSEGAFINTGAAHGWHRDVTDELNKRIC